MEAKLSAINVHLARIVFIVASVFSIAVTLLAGMTGETLLLMATAVGVASAAYAVQIMRPDAVGETTRESRTLAEAA